MSSNELFDQIEKLCAEARDASRIVAGLSTAEKNKVLERIAEKLEQNREKLKQANAVDVEKAQKDGLSAAMVDRLELNDKRIDDMIAGVNTAIELEDPAWSIIKQWKIKNGLEITRMRVPIGVIGIIYESRPNVTVDAGILCFKSGNVAVLRGGKESFYSNVCLAGIMQDALIESQLPTAAIQVIETIDRGAVAELLKMKKYVDLIIPRGGEGLINFVTENSHIPVIKHYKGVCHVYVDAQAKLDMAQDICVNAKVQRPGVCNAIEKILVHKAIAADFVPEIVAALEKHGVEVRGDEESRLIIPRLIPAVEQDWYEEYLDLIVAIKVVESNQEAIAHINHYGSGHSDAIVTQDTNAAVAFLRGVDSSTVYHNASTRFTDGGQFGFGAEIGISTDKIHARGPMALEELTTYKYIVNGQGQIRE